MANYPDPLRQLEAATPPQRQALAESWLRGGHAPSSFPPGRTPYSGGGAQQLPPHREHTNILGHSSDEDVPFGDQPGPGPAHASLSTIFGAAGKGSLGAAVVYTLASILPGRRFSLGGLMKSAFAGAVGQGIRNAKSDGQDGGFLAGAGTDLLLEIMSGGNPGWIRTILTAAASPFLLPKLGEGLGKAFQFICGLVPGAAHGGPGMAPQPAM